MNVTMSRDVVEATAQPGFALGVLAGVTVGLQHGLKHRDRSSTHSGETPRMGSHTGACRFSEATK